MVPLSLFREGYKNVMLLAEQTQLTAPQLSLLNRGLTFIPSRGSSKNNKLQVRFDIQKYHRRLKLSAYYGEDVTSEKLPFTAGSTWTPPDAKLPPHILELIKLDLDYFQNSFRNIRAQPNLTHDEILSLKDLANNKNIVIKPADKGSIIVVMDRQQYLWEGKRQLENKKYYSKLKKPIYLETLTQIIPIFQKLHEKKFINAKQRNYLIGDSEPRPRYFYLLPKIHKDPANWSKPFKIPPGRPIVSDCSSETYRSAEFIDFYLNPLATKHKSYIKDTYDFIEKVKKLQIAPNSILFTIDVDSLYTNIDTKEGIQAVKNIFYKFHDKKRPDKELLQLLEINLTRNDFEFDGQYFLQIKGTAMGKKFAPAYADIFMAEWESAALEKCEKRPLHYYRYLDDIWGIWMHSEEEFHSFMNTLNNHNPSIKLKATIDQNSVNFLDTTTFKGPKFTQHNQLDIKVYFKETDTHALLHKNSHHPKHTFAGLVKSQLLRFHRICTQKDDFKLATKVLFSALSTRGYSRTFLRSCFKTFLQTKPTQVSTALPFITTYSPSTVSLVRRMKKHFQTVMEGKQPGGDLRIIAAFRKNKNLKDCLVRSRVGHREGRHPRPTNNYFKQIKWLQNSNTQRVFKVPITGTTNSKNCVYIIICKKCGKKYIGETGRTIHLRFQGHKQNILRQKNTDRHVVRHFVNHGWNAVQASVLECNPHWTTSQRRRAERNWINKLGTTHPQGLNERLFFRS